MNKQAIALSIVFLVALFRFNYAQLTFLRIEEQEVSDPNESNDEQEISAEKVFNYRLNNLYQLFNFENKSLARPKCANRIQQDTTWKDSTEFAKTIIYINITELVVEVTEEAITYSFGNTVEKTFDSGDMEERVEEYNTVTSDWDFDEYYAFSFNYTNTEDLESFTLVIISPEYVQALANSPLTTWSKKGRRLRLI